MPLNPEPPRTDFVQALEDGEGRAQRKLNEARWRRSNEEFPRSAEVLLFGSCANGVMTSKGSAFCRSRRKLLMRRTSGPKISLPLSSIWLQTYAAVTCILRKGPASPRRLRADSWRLW